MITALFTSDTQDFAKKFNTDEELRKFLQEYRDNIPGSDYITVPVSPKVSWDEQFIFVEASGNVIYGISIWHNT